MIAERISPRIGGRIAANLDGAVLVSGTNGKTTTTRLIVDLLERAGIKTVSNPSGANLLRGVTSTLIAHRREMGDIEDAPVAVLEVDEMSLDRVAAQLPVRVLVTTNLVRDQLDRYGETDAILQRWTRLISAMSMGSIFVACADDPRLMYLASRTGSTVRSYGLSAAPPLATDAGLTPEVFACPACDGQLERSWIGLGHLGDYHCRRCGFRRIDPWLSVCIGRAHGFEGTELTFHLPNGQGDHTLNLGLPGVSSAYNAAAALTAVASLGVPLESAVASLSSLLPPWGRYEHVDINGREVILALGKNPASLAELVRIGSTAEIDAVLVAVNDAIADGRDASWYWDVDLSPLLVGRHYVLTGSRRLDLALRLKYAPDGRVDPGLLNGSIAELPAIGLDRLIEESPPGSRILAVLTYTALIELRGVLAKRGLVQPAPA